MKFVLGMVVGALLALYGKFARENYKAMHEYDNAMTDLFNSIPQEQRYGYTEDFPAGTKWQL